MSSPLITTVIPTFQRPHLLCRAVESVQAQTFNNLKICIFDNASDDATGDVVADMQKLDKRIYYTKRDVNIGPGPNMVRAVTTVDTPFFSLLNDDDFLLPDMYSESIAAFDAHDEIGFVCSKTLSVDVTKGSMQFRNREWSGGVYSPSSEVASKMFASHFVQTGVVMRTDMTNIIGPFDLLGNDALFMTIAAAAKPFAVIDAYRSVFSFHPSSYSVAHGLSSEPEARLHEAMVSSVGFLVRSNLPDERKFHLMMLITHFYREILNIKSVKSLPNLRERQGSAFQSALPSSVTLSSLALALYQSCPAALRSIARVGIGAMRSQRSRQSRRDSSWSSLPQSAHEYLRSGGCDSKKFMALASIN